MVMNAVQFENKLNVSPTTTKDKVLSVRVEDSLYSLLEELTEDWKTGSVSKTVRTLLLYYFSPMFYEEQWEQVHSENFNKYVQELLNEGNEIELQKYKNMLEKFSSYLKLFRTINEKVNATEQFLSEHEEMLEKVVSRLEEVSILWKGKVFEGKKKQK